jgi:tRNA (mo5U34)-methyltransferase
MGVLYHLRHPLLALDLIHEHVAGDLLLFQSLQAGTKGMFKPEPDYEFFAGPEGVRRPEWPRLHFVEQRYAGDSDQLVGAQRAPASAGMLRAPGSRSSSIPRTEVFLCRRAGLTARGAVYPLKGSAA